MAGVRDSSGMRPYFLPPANGSLAERCLSRINLQAAMLAGQGRENPRGQTV